MKPDGEAELRDESVGGGRFRGVESTALEGHRTICQ